MEIVSYPKQVGSIKRLKKTLGVDAELYLPNLEDGDSPLEMHCGYSRFVFTLIDKEGGEIIYPKANIPAREIDYIKEKTDIALQTLTLKSNNKVIDNNNKQEAYTNNLKAYNQKITLGKFKGKTPAAILIEDKSLAEELNNQRNFLMKNADKYPANRIQAEAIEEALLLLEKNELKSDNLLGVDRELSQDIVIYEAQYKPLLSISDKQGNHFVYSISIKCDPNKKYPFILTITNWFAPVKKNSQGLTNPIMSQAIDMKQSILKMTEMEWYSLITRINRTVELFEMINFKKQFMLAEEHYNNNKNDYHIKKVVD